MGEQGPDLSSTLKKDTSNIWTVLPILLSLINTHPAPRAPGQNSVCGFRKMKWLEDRTGGIRRRKSKVPACQIHLEHCVPSCLSALLWDSGVEHYGYSFTPLEKCPARALQPQTC